MGCIATGGLLLTRKKHGPFHWNYNKKTEQKYPANKIIQIRLNEKFRRNEYI